MANAQQQQADQQDQQQPQQKELPPSSFEWLKPLYNRQLPLQMGFWLPPSRVERAAVKYDVAKAEGHALSVVVQCVRSSVDLLMVKPAVRVVAVDRHTGSIVGSNASFSTAVQTNKSMIMLCAWKGLMMSGRMRR